jgi:hypothetical protein
MNFGRAKTILGNTYAKSPCTGSRQHVHLCSFWYPRFYVVADVLGGVEVCDATSRWSTVGALGASVGRWTVACLDLARKARQGSGLECKSVHQILLDPIRRHRTHGEYGGSSPIPTHGRYSSIRLDLVYGATPLSSSSVHELGFLPV